MPCRRQLARSHRQEPTLHRELLKAAYAFQTQVTQTALANGRSKIEERLARWLLMADDRIDGDELPLTHEFLSLMLGVQRSGVTLAVQALEQDGLIEARRGRISILNRAELEKKSNGTYTPQTDYARGAPVQAARPSSALGRRADHAPARHEQQGLAMLVLDFNLGVEACGLAFTHGIAQGLTCPFDGMGPGCL